MYMQLYMTSVHAQSLRHVWLFATPWTLAHQAPLSMGFSRQEPFPSPGNLPNPGIEPQYPVSPTLAGIYFTSEPSGKPIMYDTAAAAAKSFQSYPTLCDPIDSSLLGSSVPGILQARTLEWVAISFSNMYDTDVTKII